MYDFIEIEPKKGTKFDDDKPMLSLLPPDAMMELGKVATIGAKKYGNHNYRNGIPVTRLISASLRHITAFMAGSDHDEEDGNSHLASAAWNCLAALQVIQDKPEFDDRYKG